MWRGPDLTSLLFLKSMRIWSLVPSEASYVHPPPWRVQTNFGESFLVLRSPSYRLMILSFISVQFTSVQLLSSVRLFATPWITACQVSLSITNSQSSPKLTSIESVMPSSHLILCRPLFLLPSIPPSIRVFSNESTLLLRWPKYQIHELNLSKSWFLIF